MLERTGESTAGSWLTKNTVDENTPPSNSRPGRKPKELPASALTPVAEQAPLAMVLPFLEPTTQPAPAPNAVAREAALPPPFSATVTYHHPENGGGLLALVRGATAVSAAEEEVVSLHDSDVPKTVLSCDVCHSSVKLPVYQCSLLRHVACSDCGAGECRPCADLGNGAVYAKNSYLETLFGYFKVPCPYKKYGCGSPVAYRDIAAHTAACACAPCTCPECSFEGSPAELVRHLTDKAGPHGWTTTKIKYSTDIPFTINAKKVVDGRFLFVAEEDGGVFLLLAVGCRGRIHIVDVFCVRINAGKGPVYSSSVAVEGPLAEGVRHQVKKKAMASCSVPVEVKSESLFRSVLVYPEMLHGDEIHLCICIRKN